MFKGVFKVVLKSVLKIAAVLGICAGLAGPAAAQGRFTPEQIDDLERVNQYLNNLGFLTGRFVQISDTGGAYVEGTFYIAERTRMRFEYDPPIPLTFISDGNFVGTDNSEMETTTQYPIGATPLRVLLRQNVDLTQDANITAVERLPGQLRIVATEDSGLAQGELTLVFSDPGLELRQWVVVDAQGYRTTIALQEVQEVDDLPDTLFDFPEYDNSDLFD